MDDVPPPFETETPSPLVETPLPGLRPASPAHDRPQRERQSQREAKIYKVKADCIGCGQKLAVRAELLRKRLKCPACGMRMHIGRDGKWYEGHAPKPAEVDPALDLRTSVEINRPSWWRTTRHGRFILRYARQFQLAALGAVLIAAAGWGVTRISVQDLPESLDQRTELVAQAVVKRDQHLLGRLTDSRTGGELRNWANEAYRKIDPRTAKWTSEILHTDFATRKATTVARISSTGQSRKELVLQWTLGDDKLWRLDADRTAKSR